MERAELVTLGHGLLVDKAKTVPLDRMPYTLALLGSLHRDTTLTLPDKEKRMLDWIFYQLTRVKTSRLNPSVWSLLGELVVQPSARAYPLLSIVLQLVSDIQSNPDVTLSTTTSIISATTSTSHSLILAVRKTLQLALQAHHDQLPKSTLEYYYQSFELLQGEAWDPILDTLLEACSSLLDLSHPKKVFSLFCQRALVPLSTLAVKVPHPAYPSISDRCLSMISVSYTHLTLPTIA